MKRLLPVLALLAIVTDSVVAATIHVPGDQSTIEAGLVAASAGDTVLVACGTYYEHDIRAMKSGVCLTSETGLADCVTIDAQQQDGVFYCSGVDSLASIVGFTITGGSSNDYGGMYCNGSSLSLRACTFVGNIANGSGGGMVCSGCSPTLTDCTFEGNQATYSGGVSCSGSSSSPTFTNCRFVGNQAYDGGGMSCGYGSPTLTGCTFVGNQAGQHGAGVHCFLSSLALTECTFEGNQASDRGGGMYCFNSSPTLTTCTFVGNEAIGGGGMHCDEGSSPTLTACTFVGNTASSYGGGMSCAWSTPTLAACIIAFSQQGAAVYCSYDTPELSCCDIYGNVGGDWVDCIADQYGVNGNFYEDPLFCDMYSGDLTLCGDSPCLPDSNDCGVLIGAHEEGCPPCGSAVEATSWGSMKAMFR